MKIEILVGDKGNVDFSAPIEMPSDEREKFFKMLSGLFDPVEEEARSLRNWRIGGNRIQYPRTWTEREYEVLLKSRTLEEAENKLARSGMAIIVQDGKWRPQFFEWCQKKGQNPFSGDMVKLIHEFMKEKADELIAKRRKRQVMRQKERELLELKDNLKNLDSEEERQKIELLIKLRQIPNRSVADYVAQRKKQIHKEMVELEASIPEHKTQE